MKIFAPRIDKGELRYTAQEIQFSDMTRKFAVKGINLLCHMGDAFHTRCFCTEETWNAEMLNLLWSLQNLITFCKNQWQWSCGEWVLCTLMNRFFRCYMKQKSSNIYIYISRSNQFPAKQKDLVLYFCKIYSLANQKA